MAQLKLGTVIDGNVAWHAGNDGSGSGLDADTLDGVHGANYARLDIANIGAIAVTAGASSTIPLIVKGAASQTANLQEWQSSTPTTLALITPTGEFQAPDFKATGLTGATAASRYVGATTSGAPVSGTFAVGDYVIDQTAKIWICTVAGSSGTWVGIAGVRVNDVTFTTSAGTGALNLSASGSADTAFGYNALTGLTSGNGNVAFGSLALDALTSGNSNTAIGANSLGAISTVGNNTAVGYNALTVSTAADLTAVGYSALAANTSGTQNTAVGTSALAAVQTGTTNTAVGYNALLLATGSGNTGVGALALDALTSGGANTAIGVNALTAVSTASNNTAIGNGALQANTAADNTAIGYSALTANNSGTQNTAIGTSAAAAITTGTHNTVVGYNALLANTGLGYNTAIGSLALSTAGSGESNTAVGQSALKLTTSGTLNTGVGVNAATANTTGAQNVAIGVNALQSNQTSSNNTALGTSAMNSTTAGQNTAVGRNALAQLSSGVDNVGMGHMVGDRPNNVVGNATTTGNRQTLIGSESGQGSSTARNNVSTLGYRALVNGDYATALGSLASAGAAGSVALGTDSGGAGAATTTANEIRLGTANHTTYVPGMHRTTGRWRTVATKTSAYTITDADDIILCNHATTAFTITLPASPVEGKTYTIKNINAALVTVDPNSTDTIDLAATKTLAQWESIDIVALDGTQRTGMKWVII